MQTLLPDSYESCPIQTHLPNSSPSAILSIQHTCSTFQPVASPTQLHQIKTFPPQTFLPVHDSSQPKACQFQTHLPVHNSSPCLLYSAVRRTHKMTLRRPLGASKRRVPDPRELRKKRGLDTRVPTQQDLDQHSRSEGPCKRPKRAVCFPPTGSSRSLLSSHHDAALRSVSTNSVLFDSRPETKISNKLTGPSDNTLPMQGISSGLFDETYLAPDPYDPRDPVNNPNHIASPTQSDKIPIQSKAYLPVHDSAPIIACSILLTDSPNRTSVSPTQCDHHLTPRGSLARQCPARCRRSHMMTLRLPPRTSKRQMVTISPQEVPKKRRRVTEISAQQIQSRTPTSSSILADERENADNQISFDTRPGPHWFHILGHSPLCTCSRCFPSHSQSKRGLGGELYIPFYLRERRGPVTPWQLDCGFEPLTKSASKKQKLTSEQNRRLSTQPNLIPRSPQAVPTRRKDNRWYPPLVFKNSNGLGGRVRTCSKTEARQNNNTSIPQEQLFNEPTEADDSKHDFPPELLPQGSTGTDIYLNGASSQLVGVSDRGFNTIKIFGSRGVRDSFTFLNLCKLYGIPITANAIESFQRKGYRSGNFDSRSLLIIFKSNILASKADRALSYVEKFKPHFKNYRHQTSLTLRKRGNRFHWINHFSDDLPEDEPDEKLDANDEMLSDNNHVSFNDLCPENGSTKTSIQCYSRIATWNIQTFNGKFSALRSFLTTNNIHILGMTETKEKNQNVDSQFSDYQWFGRKSVGNKGGVGFLVHHSVLLQREFKIFNGKGSDSIYLYLKSGSGRHTLLGLVYGKSKPSREDSSTQFKNYWNDLKRIQRKLPKNLDIIFMGDINARVGNPQNDHERAFLGRYGETERNNDGDNAVDFMDKAGLICLNNRDRKFAGAPQYTYHMRGNESSKSVIDVICVSKGMMREEYKARVLPLTLSGAEAHYPVLADIRLFRKNLQPRRPIPRIVWNLQVLESEQISLKFRTARDLGITEWRKLNFDSISESAGAFASRISKAADSHVKKITIRERFHKSRHERRYDTLLKSINKFRRKFFSVKLQPDSIRFKELAAMEGELKSLKSSIKQQTNRYLQKQITKAKKGNNPKRFFKFINNFQSDNAASSDIKIKCIKNKHGVAQLNKKDIHDVFFDYWHNMFTNDDDQIEIEEFDVENAASGECHSLCNKPITLREIETVLKSLKEGKAIGTDDIAAVFLMDDSQVLASGLQRLFNSVLSS